MELGVVFRDGVDFEFVIIIYLGGSCGFGYEGRGFFWGMSVFFCFLGFGGLEVLVLERVCF